MNIPEQQVRGVLNRLGHGRTLFQLTKMLKEIFGFDTKKAASLAQRWMTYSL